MKLTKKQLTQAVQQYARRHGYYTNTVRGMTVLLLAAIKEWKEKNGYETRIESTSP